MLGEHAKREMVTDEKLEGSGRKNNEWTPSKEAGDKYRRNLLPPSCHIGRVTRRRTK
jgi:hypothetical protein